MAVVFLLVLIGTIVSRSAEAPVDNASTNVAEPPSDPLAELGVAPGQSTENEAVTSNQR